MHDSAGNRTAIARFCLAVVLAIVAPGSLAQAAGNAQLWLEQDETLPPSLYSILGGGVTLTGFHCDVINNPSLAAFTADPDYRETQVTIGVEMLLEEVTALQAPSTASRMDDASGADPRTPLNARVSRVLTQQEMSAPPGNGEMEEVFVPEASMVVADLMALCLP
jgi:hypothetical protein